MQQIDQFNSNRIENMTRGDTTIHDLPHQTCPISPRFNLKITRCQCYFIIFIYSFRSSIVSFWYEKVQHCSTTSEMEFHRSILEWKRLQSSSMVILETKNCSKELIWTKIIFCQNMKILQNFMLDRKWQVQFLGFVSPLSNWRFC